MFFLKGARRRAVKRQENTDCYGCLRIGMEGRINGIPFMLERYYSDLLQVERLSYQIEIPQLQNDFVKFGGSFSDGAGFMMSLGDLIRKKSKELNSLWKLNSPTQGLEEMPSRMW